MTGAEKDLNTLLAAMRPTIREGEYVYAVWPEGKPLAGHVAAAVRESEGLTVVLPRADADALGLHYDYVAAWITLQVHSALEAIGLTAAVSAALAEAKISCNVLAGFHHDHLLVPVADAARAVEALHELSDRSRSANGAGQPAAPRLVLRSEEPADRAELLALTAAAFTISPVTGERVEGEPEEVELLRRLFNCPEYLPEFSIVAELDGELVGHVISTRGRAGELELLGLGPIGVLPRLQRHGIGSALMQETIDRANAAGERGIALLGSPDYYARFGFVPSTSLGVQAPDPAWGEHFQILPLALWPGGASGVFQYAQPFDGPPSA
ncbi:N-acetyltransferase [Arthrobacter sp. Soil763]|uniref:N-acetyltransferase n=1 Tax=Arthrobacter sp. Soil763 TaxID=1736402 RepID=UPI0006FB191C|nr:ACT domain-containing protein [Arthrobacter sp. Soil763]KRE77326.1 GCN5 family acetyltransferase [Arthrobacter sp. Soil763]